MSAEASKVQPGRERKEYYKAYNKAYYAAHRDELKACFKAYRAAHRDERNAYHKAYLAAHRDEEKARCEAYHAAHRDKTRLYDSQPENKNRKLALQRIRAFGLRKNQIPDELLETIKNHVALCRAIKQKKEALNV